MADNKLLSQMLEHLVNEDSAKAEELFHEYVVAKSREIYENLIETEISEEEEVDEATDEEDEDKVDEASEEDKDEDEKVDENFEDLAIEADDEMDMGGDPTDDLAGELDGEENPEGEESEEEIMSDLGDIIDELQAKFDALTGSEEEQDEFGGEDEMGAEEQPKEEFELETVREYVEKVPAGHGAEKKGSAEAADNKSSVVAGKNDMGGTAANILGGKEDSSSKGTAGGLAGNKPKEENAGNINVPGGKAGNAFSTKEPGHGAEKKGAGENADNKQSLFRGRR
jgi:hypothetical protein